MADIDVNVADIIKGLSADLGPTLSAAMLAVAAETQDRAAPYPAAPPRGNPWYERGVGSHYRRKDGRVTTRKTSETMNRRWTIAAAGTTSARVKNLASYSAYAHGKADQSKVMQRHGWRTVEDEFAKLEASGVVERIVLDAVANRLGWQK